MTYKYAVYNKYGGLVVRTLTRGRAEEMARQYKDCVVKAEEFKQPLFESTTEGRS